MIEQLFNHTNHYFSLQTLGIIIVLVSLEAVLSADNAVALAVIVNENLNEPNQQQRALNWGLLASFALRVLLLICASWIIQFWQFEFAGALYLLWLSFKYFWKKFKNEDPNLTEYSKTSTKSFWSVIGLIAITDLAFSIDSVTTAVALSNQLWLVLLGCLLGVIALRFLTNLFVRWLNEYSYLQDAAYLTISGVGLRLFIKALIPIYLVPEWIMLLIIAVIFTWGFSKRDLSKTN